MAKPKKVWRVRYTPSVWPKETYTTDRGLALRVARHCKLVGWPAEVNRVSMKRARLDHSFDPWGEPFNLVRPGTPVMSNTLRRRALRLIASWRINIDQTA